jgi:hypothetical protein
VRARRRRHGGDLHLVAHCFEVVTRRRQRGVAVARDNGAAARFEVDPRQSGKHRRHSLQIQRRTVAIVDVEIELRFGRRPDRHAQRARRDRVLHDATKRGRAELHRRRLGAGEPRLVHSRAAQDVLAADGEIERDDGQMSARQRDAEAAVARLAGAPVEAHRRRQRRCRNR